MVYSARVPVTYPRPRTRTRTTPTYRLRHHHTLFKRLGRAQGSTESDQVNDDPLVEFGETVYSDVLFVA
jgi:hypothetical protein